MCVRSTSHCDDIELKGNQIAYSKEQEINSIHIQDMRDSIHECIKQAHDRFVQMPTFEKSCDLVTSISDVCVKKFHHCYSDRIEVKHMERVMIKMEIDKLLKVGLGFEAQM